MQPESGQISTALRNSPRAALAAGGAVWLGLAASAIAQDQHPGDTAAKAWPAAQRAIERNCGACHIAAPESAPSAPRWPSPLTPQGLAEETALVRPGNPDASALFTMFQMRHGAHDLLADPAARRIPAEDHLAVRDWIAALPAPGTPRHEQDARQPGPVDEPLQLRLAANSARYRSGDAIVLTVTATRPCHLTLISLDGSGRSTVLFPNDFATNTLLEPGKSLAVPAEGAAYALRADTPGRETVAAVCQMTAPTPFGIKHDFDRRRFTELGAYRAFLLKTWSSEAEARHAVTKPESSKPRRRGRRRIATPPPPPPPGPVEQVRTAIQFDVE